MWLINTETLQLHEFIDPVVAGVRYAILSHTWGTPQEEVSFKDFSDLEQARKKIGFAKIEKTCEIARSQQLEYAWVDTCCIDKSSSAELSEAINSMFQWYRMSEICYIFLADLHDEPYDTSISLRKSSMRNKTGDTWSTAEKHYLDSNFARCRWFSRGWTLQELIAPRTAMFYDAKWQRFATKHDIAPILSLITGIHKDILYGTAALGDTPIFTRMSWAAKRNTTRVEDTAYCLLGIFDINFPLIYGEGPKAFRRLQEEIIRKTDDLSILAWSGRTPPDLMYRPRGYSRWQLHSHEYRGALAWAPCEFTKPPMLMDEGPLMEQHKFAPQGSLELRGAQGLTIRNASIIHRITKGDTKSSGQQVSLEFLQVPCLDSYVYRLLRRCTMGHFLAGPTQSVSSLGPLPDDMFEMREIVSTMTLIDILSPKDTKDLRKPVVELEMSMQTMENEHLNKYIMQSQPVWPISRWSEVDRCFAMNPDELADASETKLVAVQCIRQDIHGPGGSIHGLEILCCVGDRPRRNDWDYTDPPETDLLVMTIVRPTRTFDSGISSSLDRILEHARMMKALHWVDHKLLIRKLRIAARTDETRVIPFENRDGSSIEVKLRTSVCTQSVDETKSKHFVQLTLDLPNGYRAVPSSGGMVV